ncbi:MAG: peptide chain release factor N(5)-glutamine methyltransferase [Gloeocapsa sp. DLM2.Bin57]|nr:MAG: peptide chain release factor N(5)-glutamine methyltransferase [Gloeocapsa sp. DLM2.Bin57]
MVNPKLRVKLNGKTLHKWRYQAIATAKTAGINPTEVDWLLTRITNLSKLDLRLESYLNQDLVLSEKSLTELTQLWEQRIKKNVPVQYLINTVYWRDFKLQVSQDVLIPRPETELIIDLLENSLKFSENEELKTGVWVDLGTGSGAIALGLAQLLPEATIYAVDISKAALAIAATNAAQLHLENRIKFQQGDWWSPLKEWKGKISGMVSNPPYIPTAMIAQLQPEVTLHEPHLALDGGKNGLESLLHLVVTAPDYLCSGGIWLCEIMSGQGQQVAQLLSNQGSYHKISIYSDLANLERFVLAYKK